MSKKNIVIFTLVLLALAGGYLARERIRVTRQGGMSESAAAPASRERKVLYWVDPMHPAYKSDKPGKAPDCGMDLVPVYAEEGPPPAVSIPPGAVQISAQKQQLIGLQYGEVSYGPLAKTIRTIGRITYDETKVTHIHTKVIGYIEEVFVNFVGKEVQKGEPLFTLYSPELVSTQQEYLIALRSRNYLKDVPEQDLVVGTDSLARAARERLRLWDIREEDIQAIEKQGEAKRTLTIYSPVNGIVTERAAYHHGRYVSPDMDLYTIIDLSTVWVLADIYEYELPMVKVGDPATMTLAYFPGKTYPGKVTYIYPQLDNITRTLKVRLEFPNPNLSLKPDMYANVELRADYGRQIWVPAEAVLDSGTEQIVFVALRDGYFQPRKVQVGPRVDDRYIILSGVKPGEKIVTSGNFLVDSESRLKSAMGAMAGMGHAGETPAAEKPVPEMKPQSPPSGPRKDSRPR